MFRSAGVAIYGPGALAALVAAVWLALQHPLSAPLALAGVLSWTIVMGRFPRCWLFVLPASLPLLDFAPWTGWTVFDEFDLLVLATVAGGYAGLTWRSSDGAPPLSIKGRRVVGVLAVLTLLSVWRGMADAGIGAGTTWYQDDTGPFNSLRVAKSALFALLLLPLLRRDASAPDGRRLFGCGMVAGIVFVTLAVLWERTAYPGLLDFDEPYRTSALFWEMHLGGAAIDAYLALATPFVAWALWAARGPRHWLAAALLAVAWGYVCLTSFSRGAYLGVVTPLLLLGFFRLLGGTGWRRAGSALIAVALVAEIVVVFGWGTFMSSRVSGSQRDYQSRLAHWSDGLDLLREPADWVVGLGAGRLPAHLGEFEAEFPGRIRWVEDGSVMLSGPRSRPQLSGLYGLTQRLPLRASYRVSVDVHVTRLARMQVRVCESHLLYDRTCQIAEFLLRPSTETWQRVSLDLRGPPLRPGLWFAPRQAVMTVAVIGIGTSVRLTRMVLQAPGETQLLANPDFMFGLERWLPVAQFYFVPWHIDNLFLEWMIEYGAAGLFAFGAIVATLFARVSRRRMQKDLQPFLAASLLGVLCVGLVSSVLDAPRVALLMFLVMALLMVGLEGDADPAQREP